MIEIIPAEMKHISDIIKIEQASFDPPWSEDALMSELGRSDAFFAVAVEEGTVLGFCVLRLLSGEAELFQIAVAQEDRRSGIGSRLLEEALAFSVQNGAVSVFLEVRKSSEAAIGLYEKFGFLQKGIRKNYYTRPAEDAVIMEYTQQTAAPVCD